MNTQLLTAALILATAATATASEEAFQKAEEAIQAGQLADMQAAYESVLQSDPDNVRALNGKATAQAWRGNYAAARQTYQQVLASDERNVQALIGKGYAHAWDGQYLEAHTLFQRALRIAPDSMDARKGIAYNYLWEGSHDLALGAFQSAASLAPEDAEIAEAIGQVKLAQGRNRDAIPHFDQALALDPARSSASNARRAAYMGAPALEVQSRFGTTSGADAGLRHLEIAHWPSRTTRFAVRYDNSLGLDNPSIADRGGEAPGYFGSVQQLFKQRFLIGFEAGQRDLISEDQTVVALQGTWFAPLGAIRLGVQNGRTDSGINDTLLYGGVGFTLNDRWQLEPMLYVSESGADDDSEWRATLGASFDVNDKLEVGGFIGGGRIDASDPAANGDTSVAGLRANYLWADRYSFHLGVRREETPANSFTVAEIGFTYRMISN